MCGITGWVDRRRDLREWMRTAEEMTGTLAARGPDAGGVWVGEDAFLGHRRLSVIDLENGHQPMAAALPSPVVLSYSGEVYNHRELREELRRAGHTFTTSSDTEVVLRGYLEWGGALFPRLNGMYAFAVWDERDRSLSLVRDRLGIKPLYYAPTPDGVVFGSEPKALLANPLVDARLGPSGVGELFALATAPTPGHAVFEGMAQVQPAHVVRSTPHGLEETRYWALEAHEHTDDAATTTARVRALLEETVEQQLVSDVPLGALLSGGVDSSAITALAAHGARGEGSADGLPTFSVDFPRHEGPAAADGWHNSHDEPFARAAAQHLGTRHTTVLLDRGEAQSGEQAVLRARDLPGWGELDISLHRLFAGVRAHTTVALSGESADEIFGGYPYFHDPRALEHEGFPWLADKDGPSRLLRADAAARTDPRGYAHHRYRQALSQVPELDGAPPEEARIRRVGHLALTRWLPALLDRKDRMSMAVGLEVRVPFCDHRLVEYVWNVPWSVRAADGRPKALLRDAVADLLPPAVAQRRKSAFPANPDPVYVASLRRRVQDLVATGESPLFDLVDRAAVREHLERDAPLPSPRATSSPAAGLGFLLNLDRWLRDYDVEIV